MFERFAPAPRHFSGRGDQAGTPTLSTGSRFIQPAERLGEGLGRSLATFLERRYEPFGGFQLRFLRSLTAMSLSRTSDDTS